MALSNVEVDDRELMAHLADGEVSYLGEIYLRYGALVRRRIAYFASDFSREEIEDLCQDVFLTAYKAAPRYKESGRLSSWLSGIARKKVGSFKRKTFLRRKLMGRYTEQKKLTAVSRTSSDESVAVLRESFERALTSIHPGYREILMMSAAEEMSGEEIARALGINVGAVWTKLHRARRAMQAAMATDSVKGSQAR